LLCINALGVKIGSNADKLQFYDILSLSSRFIKIQYNKMNTKNQGTVKFFNTEKGFGFIRHNDSDKETFVHVSGLINEIREGDQVEFDLQNGKKGMNAVNVTVVG